MSMDPAGFVRRWLSSQKRDLEVLLGESGRGDSGIGGEDEMWRFGGEGGEWGKESVRETVRYLLARPESQSLASK